MPTYRTASELAARTIVTYGVPCMRAATRKTTAREGINHETRPRTHMAIRQQTNTPTLHSSRPPRSCPPSPVLLF